MARLFTTLAATVLLVVAAMLAVGSSTGVGLVVVGAGGTIVAGWIAAALTMVLALGVFWEMRRGVEPARGRSQQPAPQPALAERAPAPQIARPTAVRPAAVRPANGNFESVLVDGRPTPAAYFMFASKTLSVAAIRKAKDKYARVLVGFDAGGIPMSGDVENDSFAVARDLGAELEIYVEGPGGKTGDAWDPGEEARVKAAAKSVGIDTREKGWRAKHWDTHGWKTFTFNQLAYYRGIGFSAGEIDNLDRVIKGPEQLVAFYREYGERQLAGELPQLVMKNISAEDTTAVVEALKSSVLNRQMFADFHIFECGKSDDWKEVDDISKAQGIRTVPSTNTYDYDAKGTFGLDAEFANAMGLDQPASTTTPTS